MSARAPATVTALPGKTKRKPASRKKRRDVLVRLYNVGFGDCFLLQFPGAGRARRMLVDCGSIAKAGHDMADVVAQLIKDVTDADGVPRIDVVVATHRHRDHVSGFAQAGWAEVEVREVWMPWTEHPSDPRARRIRTCQNRLAMHLAGTFGQPVPTESEADEEWSDARPQMALNALSNEPAMATLHSGFAGEPRRRYLPGTAAEDRVFHSDALPGVTVHVIGPPYDEDVMRDLEPPAGQSYLSLVDDEEPGRVIVPEPFAESWWAEEDPGLLSAEERGAIEGAGGGLAGAALIALEKAVNGTSLFLLLQVGKAHLVFPGDAQWGTWKAAADSAESWELLRKTTFYKIGHHGSHNATPVDYVDELGENFVAMASVKPVKKWPEIPRLPLLEELGAKGTIMRSDKLDEAPENFKISDDGLTVQVRIPT